jgi:hypothetical protein
MSSRAEPHRLLRSSPVAKRTGEGDRRQAVEGAAANAAADDGPRISLNQHDRWPSTPVRRAAPSTMLRMVPLPRGFAAGEDADC